MDNAAKSHAEVIAEIRKLGLEKSFIFIKYEFLYLMKRIIAQDPNISYDELDNIMAILNVYES
jgi:hypothetical protein